VARCSKVYLARRDALNLIARVSAWPRSDENHRDLNRRSQRVHDAFAKVTRSHARDPAYRPTHRSSKAEAGL
jgi:hypothetical protein